MYIKEEDEKEEGWTKESLKKFLEGDTIQERANDYCGGRHFSTSPEGGFSMGVHRCGQHRTCEFCFGIRRNEFESKLRHKDAPDDLIAIVVDEEVAKKFLRSKKVTGDDYLRTPLNDGDNVLIVISKAIADSVKSFKYDVWDYAIDEENNIDPVLLEHLASLPEKKRSSGNLGKMEKKEKEDIVYPEPENESDGLDIVLPRLLIGTSDEQAIAQLFFEAIKETSHVRPFNADELNGLIMERTAVFQSLLTANGIDNMVIRYSTKHLSLKWALVNFITIEEIKPNVQITLNSTIGEVITPMARVFKNLLSAEIGYEKVKSIPVS